MTPSFPLKTWKSARNDTRGTKMPGSTLLFENVDVHFFGLYGPERLYLPIIIPDPRQNILYWSATRARARVARTRGNDS